MTCRVFGLVLALSLVLASPAQSQVAGGVAGGDPTRWGLAGSFVPQWEFLDFLEDAMDRSIEMTGDEVRIGFVRGRAGGGDWGVSYVRRRVDDDSTLRQEITKCVARPAGGELCPEGTVQRTRGVSLTGVQAHRFFSFGTIAGRVQIGAIVSGGVARVRGSAIETQEHLQVTVDPGSGRPVLGVATETTTIAARELFDHLPIAETLPIGGVEGAVAVLVGPGVKLRFSTGASFPSMHRLAITAIVLF